MRIFAIGCVMGAMLMTAIAFATPFPSPSAQLDLDGNCVLNINDTIISAKHAIARTPVPDGFPTCRAWYDTPTPEATPTPGV